METLQSLLSRKFILAVLVLIGGFVFVLKGISTYDQFSGLATWIMGIYVTGNVAVRYLD